MDDKVAVMNMEARGVYITLLCYCWNNNGLINDQEELKQMCGRPKNWDKIWKKVGKCFYVKGGSNKTKDGSITEHQSGGKLFNKRLDKEREKQEFWRKKSKEGGIKSGKTRRNKAKTKGGSNKTRGGSRVVEPNGNHSVSSSPSPSSSPSNKKDTKVSSCSKKPSEQDFKYSEVHKNLAKLLEMKIKERMPRHKFTGKQYLEEWANEFRIMEEKREASPEEIEELIFWVSKHDFWYKNIRSADKLRKQFGRLWAEMEDEKKGKSASHFMTKKERDKKEIEEMVEAEKIQKNVGKGK